MEMTSEDEVKDARAKVLRALPAEKGEHWEAAVVLEQAHDALRARVAELEAQAEIYRKNTTNLLEEIERQVERDRAAEQRAASLQAEVEIECQARVAAANEREEQRAIAEFQQRRDGEYENEIDRLGDELRKANKSLAESERKLEELLTSFNDLRERCGMRQIVQHSPSCVPPCAGCGCTCHYQDE